MAACGSLRHIFDKPLQENPTLLGSFESSFADEIFGELHFKEKPISDSSPGAESSSSPPSTSLIESTKPSQDFNDGHCGYFDDDDKAHTPLACTHPYTVCHRRSDSFSSFNSENLQLCTEGLGFESTDDVEDMTDEMNADWQVNSEEESPRRKLTPVNPFGEHGRRSRSIGAGEFPPPISSVGRPWVSFRSYRHDGRFVLKEIRAPNHEFLHASREDGRLKLQFLHSTDDILYEEDEEKEEEEQDLC